jgi:hypothetical protein
MNPALALLVAALLVAHAPLHARQQVADGRGRGVEPAVAGPVTGSLRPGPAPAVVASAAPNTVRVVAVEVPVDFQRTGGRYTVTLLNGFDVLGQRTGQIPPGGSGVLPLAVVVPSAALAGRAPAALVSFDCPGGDCDPAVVPIYMDVLAQPALQVFVARPAIGAAPGRRLELAVTVRNAGNAPLAVTLRAEAPPDWRYEVAAPPVIELGPRAEQSFPAVVRVPHTAGTGSFQLYVHAAAGELLSTAVLHLHIYHHEYLQRPPGPVLDAALATVGDHTGALLPALSGSLLGEAAPGVQLRGSATVLMAGELSGIAARSLSWLGLTPGISGMYLTAERWDVGVGSIASGQEAAWLLRPVHGRGLTFRYGGAGAWGRLLAAQPPGRDGHAIVLDGGRQVGPVRVLVTAADLREQGSSLATPRYTRALLAGTDVPWRGGLGTFHLGYLSGRAATGAAAGAAIQQRGRGWSVNGQARYVPGGAASFARARSEFSVDGHRALASWLSLSSGFSSSQDDREGDDYHMRSAHGAITLGAGPLGTVRLGLQQSSWSWSSQGMTLGQAERGASIAWNGATLGMALTAGANRIRGERSTALDAGLEAAGELWRTQLFAGVSGALRGAAWEVDAALDLADPMLGLPRQQLTGRAAVHGLPLVHGRLFGRFQLSGHYLPLSGVLQRTESAGLEFRPGGDYRLKIDVSREAFGGVHGHSGHAVAVQLQRAFGLPAVGAPETDGLVFADLNGNGRREPDEPGMDGVLVLINRDMVSTDERGRFRTDGRPVTSIGIDPRSLPAGWIAAPRPPVREGRLELAVMPTRPVVIQLRIDTTGLRAVPAIRYEVILVTLTDASGRSWSAQAGADGTARFDALRPGTYTVSADVSRSPEPLLLPRELPRIDVTGGMTPLTVELRLAPRPVRLDAPERMRTITGSGRAGLPPDPDPDP